MISIITWSHNLFYVIRLRLAKIASMVLEIDYDGLKKFKKGLNDPSHRVLRYVLKVGDLEEATHVFVDLLEMRVFNHHEYDSGSSDGGEVHYEGKWSRTLIGFGKSVDAQLHLQLIVNHGVAKYSRGNHFHTIEVQLESTSHLEDVGLKKGFCRGKPAYFINCNGYIIEVVKSDDGKKRISYITLNCDEPLTLSGPTVSFWTNCLGFEVVCWSTDPQSDKDTLTEYSWIRKCGFCFTRVIKRKSKFRALREDELPFIELQYGSAKDFRVRLQSLPEGVPMDIGTGRERLELSCTTDDLNEIRKLVKVIGKHTGGSETKKPFIFIPGKMELIGVVVSDPSGLEVCYYDADELRLVHETQLDAEVFLRKSISVNRQKLNERAKRNRFKIHIILFYSDCIIHTTNW